jgi:putative transposase
LEGPSWAGARLALVNVVEDKVALCKRYGIDISPEMWPNADLCQRILADRGEFEGYDASTLQNAFGVGISNVGAYRGDLKAIVERDFLMIKNETAIFVPGFTNYKVRERGQKDYRLDACLTLDEFRQTMIRHILFHNNVWRMEEYRLDTYAIQDDVPAIPIRLWNWGIEHRTGWRREAPSAERVRLALLPRATASITERGLLFKGLHYTITFPGDDEGCQAEELFVRARAEGWERVEVAFDHGKPQLIYLCLENGQRLIPCPLLPSEASFYERDDLDLYEIEDYFTRRKNGNVEHRAITEQETAKIHAEHELLFKRAQAEAKAAQEGLPKTALVDDIKGNRRREKEAEAQLSITQVGDKTTALPPAPEQSGPNDSTGYVAPASSIDILKSLLGNDKADA